MLPLQTDAVPGVGTALAREVENKAPGQVAAYTNGVASSTRIGASWRARRTDSTRLADQLGGFAIVQAELHTYRDTPTCAVVNSGAKLATDEEIGGPPSSGQ